MASMGTGTSFRQYQLCSLCKINHPNNKKHIYSKRHQRILQSIVTKFSDKIHSVRKDLFNPKVNSCNFENGAKFWCYFCKEEKSKHELFENCTVIGGGLMEHIACTDHKSNMEQFFWDNLLKKDLKPKFILPIEDFHIYKKAAFLAVKKWQKADENSRKRVAESIATAEQNRLTESANRTTSLLEETDTSHIGTNLADATGCTASRPGTSWADNGHTFINAGVRKTVSAKGEGLTCVLKQDKQTIEEGNVHTGALPPWLQPDTETLNRTEIGPTMEDYQKNLEREKKAKLPPNRVGATFDHAADRSQDWLPSFGRVWSKGRRLQSKQHFERNWKKGAKSSMKLQRMNEKDRPGCSYHMTGKAFHKDNVNNTAANQNHSQSRDWNSDLPNSSRSTDNFVTNHIVPYKRKNNQQNVTTPVIGGMFPSHTVNESSAQIIPYKRKRTTESSVTLIQTPILASSEFKR